MTSVTIPAEIEGMTPLLGSNVLAACPELLEIRVDEAHPSLMSIDGVLYQKENGSPETLVAYPRGREGAYLIPEGVSGIGEQAFLDAKGLTEVTVPGSLRFVEAEAFSNCSSLRSIHGDLPMTEGNEISGCTALEALTLATPAEETLLTNLHIDNMQNLKTLTIPEGYVMHSAWSFRDCPSLESVTLLGKADASLKVVVSGCEALREFSMPCTSPVRSVLVQDCGSLEKLDLSGISFAWESVTVQDCAALTELRAPQNIGTEGSITLQGCPAVSDVYFFSTGNSSAAKADIQKMQNVTVHFSRFDTAADAFLKTWGVPHVYLEDEVLPGDTTENGEVDIVDVIALNQNLMIGKPLTPMGRIAADRNADGKVDELDSLEILKGILKLT